MEVLIILLIVFVLAISYIFACIRSCKIKAAKNEKENLIEETISKLTVKYAFSVFNLIEGVRDIDDTYFLIIDNSHCIMSTQNQKLQDEIVKDGFKTSFHIHRPVQEQIYNLLDFYIKNLKEMIVTEDKWEDNESLDIIAYRILRNNIVVYYHDWYESHVGYETMEAFYDSNYDAKNFKSLRAIFTYYYIQELDISMPIAVTHMMLSSAMLDYGKRKMDSELKERLFNGSSKANRITDEYNDVKDNPTDAITIETIDRMAGREFEVFIAKLFKERGYKSTLTPSSGDYGIDVIVEDEFIKIGIQTKCYADKVSNSAVQEAVTGIRHYKLNRAMVITNSYFQPSAIQLAKDNDVILWDRNKLISEIA